MVVVTQNKIDAIVKLITSNSKVADTVNCYYSVDEKTKNVSFFNNKINNYSILQIINGDIIITAMQGDLLLKVMRILVVEETQQNLF